MENFERTYLNGMPVNRTLITREGQKQLVYYWFAERGMIVANEYYKKWLLLKDFLSTGRSDGSLIRVTIPVVDANNLAQSEQIITEFIASAHPVILQYLPDSSFK